VKILIMAGGTGERFWPLSTIFKPKQLLPLISDKTMISETVGRLIGLVDYKDIFIATNELQFQNIIKELPEIPKDNVIVEPTFRDTAAAILYGSTYIKKRVNHDPIITVLASDHLITNKDNFINSLHNANTIAFNENKIVTLGIKPTYPETGYGYIKVSSILEGQPVYNVKFVEKPSQNIANEYYKARTYLWNSGMFIFKYSTLIKNFFIHSIDHLNVLNSFQDSIEKFSSIELSQTITDSFKKFPKISIDFAIMEKSNDIVCIPVNIGWSDIGSFDSLDRELVKDSYLNSVKNVSMYYFQNSTNNLIYSLSDDIKVYLIDVKDLIIVKNGQNLLIVKKGSSQDIKALLKNISIESKKQ